VELRVPHNARLVPAIAAVELGRLGKSKDGCPSHTLNPVHYTTNLGTYQVGVEWILHVRVLPARASPSHPILAMRNQGLDPSQCTHQQQAVDA
jgi:hypothetical protein